MNNLVNYGNGSEDDYDDSSEEKQTDWRGTSTKDKQSSSRQTDANYEEVQMDLSEESNDSKPDTKEASRRSRDRDSKDRRDEHRSRHERDHRSSRDKDSKSRSDYSHGKRDRDRERERERKPRRSPSRERERERRRSRSPRRSERESRESRESRHSRSRSRSRDRSRKYSKRYDRGAKGGQSEKNDPQKTNEEEKRTNTTEANRFFMPGITGRFRDQIERRKQLWQKKDPETTDNNKNGQSKKVWETTTFAQDTDGKVANKFKRLMGIRGNTGASGQGVDVLKKQEEMFSSMEQQYEVARTATHTMRGVGLGFGSYQR